MGGETKSFMIWKSNIFGIFDNNKKKKINENWNKLINMIFINGNSVCLWLIAGLNSLI